MITAPDRFKFARAFGEQTEHGRNPQLPLQANRRRLALAIGPNPGKMEVKMNPQLQLWMPAVLSLFGALIVVVLTGW